MCLLTERTMGMRTIKQYGVGGAYELEIRAGQCILSWGEVVRRINTQCETDAAVMVSLAVSYLGTLGSEEDLGG